MNLPLWIDARLRARRISLLVALTASYAAATTLSETGIFSTPEDVDTFAVNLTSGGDITLQTWGFGGGVDAAGTAIPAGGFDPFVGVFAGTRADADFLSGDSDILSDYTPGCPPAGTVTIGSVRGQCGDVTLEVDGLAPGNYTILVSDGSYIPEAVFEDSPGYLGDGFADLTSGTFQTCYDAADCNSDTGAWALDITTPGDSFVAPEPSSFVLAGLAFGGLALLRKIQLHKPKEILRS